MPRAKEWGHAHPSDRFLVLQSSRAMRDEQEIQEATSWLYDQEFKGLVILDVTLRSGNQGWRVSAHFELESDRMMFKLAWG